MNKLFGLVALLAGGSLFLAGCDVDEECNEAGVCETGDNSGGDDDNDNGGDDTDNGGDDNDNGGDDNDNGGDDNGNDDEAACQAACSAMDGCTTDSNCPGGNNADMINLCEQGCMAGAFTAAGLNGIDDCDSAVSYLAGKVAEINTLCGEPTAAWGGACDHDDGSAGVCGPIDECEGSTEPGHCPGSSSVQCCIDHPCTDNSGTCMGTTACAEMGGESVAGLCPGNTGVQCCRLE